MTLSKRLRQKVIRHWTHSPGDTPRPGDYTLDPDCIEAANTLDDNFAEITALRAENERLRLGLVPVGSMLPQCFRKREEPWCREVLLYSPNNTGDTPSYRTLLYAAMGTTRNVTPTEDAILRRAAVRGATVVSKGRLVKKGTT